MEIARLSLPEMPEEGAWGVSPQFLADQLTLFQPGGQIMPTTLLLPHPHTFRPSHIPGVVAFMAR